MKAWSSLLGALGGVALLFAVLSFLLQLFSGPVLLARELSWSIGNLVLGIILLAVSVGSNLDGLRERMHSGEAQRAGKYGTSAVLATVLSLVLLSMGAYLSTRYHTRWDWTEARTHSLSSQTLKVLKGLEQDVQVTALYAAIGAAPARDLLDRYTFVSDKVKVEFVDPQAQPGRLRALGVDPGHLKEGLLHVTIGGDSVDVDKVSEAALTNAIVKLTRHEHKKVYVLIGHNERRMEGKGAKDKGGFSFAAKALRDESYEVQPLMLAAKGAVPKDADVVIAAGPTRPYLDSEKKALERYMERGGSMLVLLDPRAKTNLAGLVEKWGVDVADDVIIDRVQGLFGRPTAPLAAEYADHPITRDLRDSVLFFTARSVQPKPEAKGALNWIVRTSKNSWAERDMQRLTTTGEAQQDKHDLAGPVPVAVAGQVQLDKAPATGKGKEAQAKAPTARLVVVGDSDFATNQLIGEFRNKDFFVNSVNWLLGDVEAISIRPNRARASRLNLSSEQFLQIRYLSLFVLPELIAGLGVLAWWTRRRAPGR